MTNRAEITAVLGEGMTRKDKVDILGVTERTARRATAKMGKKPQKGSSLKVQVRPGCAREGVHKLLQELMVSHFTTVSFLPSGSVTDNQIRMLQIDVMEAYALFREAYPEGLIGMLAKDETRRATPKQRESGRMTREQKAIEAVLSGYFKLQAWTFQKRSAKRRLEQMKVTGRLGLLDATGTVLFDAGQQSVEPYDSNVAPPPAVEENQGSEIDKACIEYDSDG